MGIFQLDLIIKTAIDLGVEDMRNTPWLIDHMLGDCVDNVYLKDKYGQKQIDACREWFLNNQIDIYMRPRNDKDRMPCITITPGAAPEKEEMRHMADQSTESVILMPGKIGKPIPYVVKPFTPSSYDMSTGEVGIPENTPGLDGISEGMILVDPSNGQGFVIIEVADTGVTIEPNIDIDATQLAIVPQFQYYKARVEHTFFQETCDVSCYGHGDPQVAVWLHSIVLYSILRYRESLLEANGFTQSTVSNSPLMEDPYYAGEGGEKAFLRTITLSGMSENSWIKSPRRFIENIVLKEKVPVSKNIKGFTGGIKILSNLDSPPFIDKSEESWYTIDESKPDPSDDEEGS